jgi:hypothetical protein
MPRIISVVDDLEYHYNEGKEVPADRQIMFSMSGPSGGGVHVILVSEENAEEMEATFKRWADAAQRVTGMKTEPLPKEMRVDHLLNRKQGSSSRVDKGDKAGELTLLDPSPTQVSTPPMLPGGRKCPPLFWQTDTENDDWPTREAKKAIREKMKTWLERQGMDLGNRRGRIPAHLGYQWALAHPDEVPEG